MMKLAGLVFAVMILAACEAEPGGNPGVVRGERRFSIATWNVQALFDGDEGGTEFAEYRGKAGWNGEKYGARLTAISRAAAGMGERGPEVLAFQELENPRILEDLARGELGKLGYHWTFFAGNPGAALGLGVLSRLPLTAARSHSLYASGETTPRPVLELWAEPGNSPLVLFVCHWKSKLGGEDATEALRRASARVIARRMGEIGREFPGMPLIVLGDLNENHDEFYRRGGTALSALLPDDPRAAELAGAGGTGDFLVVSRKKPPEAGYFAPGTPALYSPWGNELSGGSYHYRGAWETIDHFLLNAALFDGAGWDFDSCRALGTAPFVNGKGYPNTYYPRSGAGLSDHLPLLLTLRLF